MKIFARYDDVGRINGFKHAKDQAASGFSGSVIEITKEQQDVYFQNPTTCGVVAGAFSEAWVDPDIEAAREPSRIANIKQEAGDRILAIAPEWKQRNMLARAVDLTHKVATGELTPAEQAEVEHFKSVWAEVDRVRKASDRAELNGTTLDEELAQP